MLTIVNDPLPQSSVDNSFPNLHGMSPLIRACSLIGLLREMYIKLSSYQAFRQTQHAVPPTFHFNAYLYTESKHIIVSKHTAINANVVFSYKKYIDLLKHAFAPTNVQMIYYNFREDTFFEVPPLSYSTCRAYIHSMRTYLKS